MDLNTQMMRATFRLEGPGSQGTAFFVGRRVPSDLSKFCYILVTADHVLADMKGEFATLHLRKKEGDRYLKFSYQFRIRNASDPVWSKHPETDVAVMYLALPEGAAVAIVPLDLLATDEELAKYEIHPGDRLSSLGYPLGVEANEAGFPVLRSGHIASFPLTPTAEVRTFLFDLTVFGGASGGPVYFVETGRSYGGTVHASETVGFVMGLVSQQVEVLQETKTLTETRKTRHPLALAVVVQASAIKEAVDGLPPEPPKVGD